MSEEKKKLRNMETPFIFEEYDKFEKKFTYKYWPLSDNSLLNAETSIEDDLPGLNDYIVQCNILCLVWDCM